MRPKYSAVSSAIAHEREVAVRTYGLDGLTRSELAHVQATLDRVARRFVATEMRAGARFDSIKFLAECGIRDETGRC